MSGLSAADVRRIVRKEIAAHQLVQSELLVSGIVRGLRESRRERGVLFGVDLLPRHAERDQGDGALRDAEALASAAGGVEVEDDNSAGLDRREVPLESEGPVFGELELHSADVEDCHDASPSGSDATAIASEETVGDGVGPVSGSGPTHTFDPRCTGGVFCPVSGHVEYRGDGRGGFHAVHIGP